MCFACFSFIAFRNRWKSELECEIGGGWWLNGFAVYLRLGGGGGNDRGSPYWLEDLGPSSSPFDKNDDMSSLVSSQAAVVFVFDDGWIDGCSGVLPV